MKKTILLGLTIAMLTACSQKANTATTNNTEQTVAEQPDTEQLIGGTEVGQRYIDIELPGIQGNKVSVSDYVGSNKFTLVDFWASWCGPCRAEMPYVVKAYTDFHAKGFEVVGVSLDNNREAWLAAIEQLRMPWPQMSDLKGWECAGAALYNIRSIPANVLIDQHGTILAKDLRGDNLLQTVANLLK